MKRYLSALMVLCFLVSMSGCKNNELSINVYDKNKNTSIAESCQISENDKYILTWNSDKAFVVLTDKLSGKQWSSLPAEVNDSLSGRASVTMGSPLYIEYMTSDSETLNTAYAWNSAINDGRIDAVISDEGITVTYFFDEFEISVPVRYSICESGLEVSVDPKEIVEGKNSLYSISLMPFMCSASNSDENGYLFVPSGSGAIMETDVRGDTVRNFSGEVYGDDTARETKVKTAEVAGIKLPVFGAKSGDNAIFAEITSGATQAFIEAQAGDKSIGYSSIYAKFYLRGYDYAEGKGNRNAVTKQLKLADTLTEGITFAVTYHPLNEENASYSGMAAYYRERLNDKKSDDIISAVDIVGGVTAAKSALGIPYGAELVLTSIEDAIAIYNDINSLTDEGEIGLVLSGFGNGLISTGKLAGGYNISKNVGGAAALKELVSDINDSQNSIYMDFDIVNYSKSGNGFSVNRSAAKAVTGVRSFKYVISPFLGSTEDSSEISYLLKRKLLDSAAQRLITLGLGTGVGLSTLSNTAYSDYSNEKTYAKAGIEAQVSNIFSNMAEKGIRVMGKGANSYAAENSNLISDIPLWSDGYNCFDYDVPFYAMVYKGHTAMSGSAINTSQDSQRDFLRCLETGTALEFSVIANYDNECIKHYEYPYAQMLYEDDRSFIAEKIKEAHEFLKAALNSEVAENNVVKNGVSYTRFSNGVEIYLNYNDYDVETDFGIVKAQDYIWKGQ